MAEIADVLTKLVERTKLGKVDWKPTADEQTFIAVLGNAVVKITKEDRALIFQVLDESGRELEHVMAVNYTAQFRGDLDTIYDLARRKALQVHSQLDELLKQLEAT